MEEDGLQWTGFRDLASPGEAALAFTTISGADAVQAARDCIATLFEIAAFDQENLV